MPTTSITTISETETSSDIVRMYRYWDGYPSVHGKELAEFLIGKTVKSEIEEPNYFGGIGRLAAQLVSYFSQTFTYNVVHLVTFDEFQQVNYYYEIFLDSFTSEIQIKIHNSKEYIFQGTPEKLLIYCDNQ
jgi:hypothetical protein